jgi:hypothetical protein
LRTLRDVARALGFAAGSRIFTSGGLADGPAVPEEPLADPGVLWAKLPPALHDNAAAATAVNRMYFIGGSRIMR